MNTQTAAAATPGAGGRARETFALVVGAGFGGIGAAIALERAGIRDFLVVERQAGPGGVWRANRYPGAACDIPSHLYSFSFAPKADWSRKYAPQAEILAYLEDCVERFAVGDRFRFGVGVVQAAFDVEGGRWEVELDDGTAIRARVLIPACGQLSRPAIPDLPGLEDFTGPCFHSACWDPAVPLAGRRVGVIGTGASAIQFVPEVARVAGAMTVFQRSPPHVLPKPDRPYGEQERRRFERFPPLQRASRLAQYWSHEIRGLMLLRARWLVGFYERGYRRLLEREISDPELRAALEPRDPLGCKRILFSNAYLEALEEPHVTLETTPIDGVEGTGIRTGDGTLHPQDVIILGTGFRATEFLAPMRIFGANGEELSQVWRGGAEAHLGISVAGFPNLFMIYGPNTNLGHNSIIFIIESQLRYILQALAHLRARPGLVLDLHPDVGERFAQRMRSALGRSIWVRGCSNWYTNASGRVVNNWPGLSLSYRYRTRRFDPKAFRAWAAVAAGVAAP